MADELPKFHGLSSENAQSFVEKLEVNCLLRGIQDPAIFLRLLHYSLQDEAKTWLQNYEEVVRAQSPVVFLDYNRVKTAFLA